MDEARRRLADSWLQKADADRRAALRLEPRDGDHALYGIAAFHWQQAAEKTLKAFLVAREVSFGRTHDISELVLLAAKADDEFCGLSDAASSLAPFAVEVRYPGDLDEPSEDEYEEVKEAALAIIRLGREKNGVLMPE